jgi:hypothetical protein
MSYRLLAGEFVIRYPDEPRNGPEPDGDTIALADAAGRIVDRVTYRSDRVRPGRTIGFGRSRSPELAAAQAT